MGGKPLKPPLEILLMKSSMTSTSHNGMPRIAIGALRDSPEVNSPKRVPRIEFGAGRGRLCDNCNYKYMKKLFVRAIFLEIIDYFEKISRGNALKTLY